MRVVVTRPASESEAWVSQLRARGFDAVMLPLIDISPVADFSELQAAWQRLPAQRAAMFVSANAVRGFFAHRAEQWPANVRAWATGGGTQHSLLGAGVPPELVDTPPEKSPQFDSEALWEEVGGQVRSGDQVLIVRGGDAVNGASAGRDWLAERLVSEGALVATVVAYQRDRPHWTPAQAELARASAGATWLFSSSQAVANLQALLRGQDWTQACAVATHPRIAQAARAASFGVVCETRPALSDVVAALESLR